MVYCSGLENPPGKSPETAEMAEFCGSRDAQNATFTNRSAGRDGAKVGTGEIRSLGTLRRLLGGIRCFLSMAHRERIVTEHEYGGRTQCVDCGKLGSWSPFERP